MMKITDKQILDFLEVAQRDWRFSMGLGNKIGVKVKRGDRWILRTTFRGAVRAALAKAEKSYKNPDEEKKESSPREGGEK
jgi:hypothetical protein